MSELQSATTAVPRSGTAAKSGTAHAPAELHIVYPRALRRRIELTGETLILGRQSPDAAGVLLEPSVSRRHVAIRWDSTRGLHTAADLGSSNGSTVDGISAQTELALRDQSVVRVGPVLLVYEAPFDAFPVARQASSSGVPGEAASTRKLRADVQRVAAGSAAVLLHGATGTGKEFVARAIHRASGRAGRLVAVNCAALSPQLVESELFGHVRGAFTGAQLEQPGLFREAAGGTLLLDEIGELPLSLQPKLLRVLQENTVRPVGGNREVAVDVRIVAATHRDLESMVERGEFRRDLYARLCLSELRLPSLRRRRADVLSWLDRFHEQWASARSIPSARLELDAAAAEAVLRGAWSENLRGLNRLVHALGQSLHAGDVCMLGDLPSWVWAEPNEATGETHAAPPDGRAERCGRRASPSREELEALLSRHGGSIRAVARELSRDRRQIYRWVSAFGLRSTM